MSDGEERPRIKDPDSPATPNQRAWLGEHGVDPNAANDTRLTKGKASEWIDQIKEQRAPAPPPPQLALPPPPPLPTLPPMVGQPVRAEVLVRSPADTSRALAPETGESPEFVPASEMASALLVTPVVSIEQAKQVWESFKAFKAFILQDEACYDDIEGSREMNRTGATRLAIPFGLSIEERSVDEKTFASDKGKSDTRFIVRVRVSKGQRFVDGVGSARLSEIPEFTREKRLKDGRVIPVKEVPLGQREHFAYTRAFTRADKRAIADLLGGTEAE